MVDPEPAESVRKQQLGRFKPPRCCGDEARDKLLEVSSCCHCSSDWMMDGWVGTSQPSMCLDLRMEKAREWCFWMRVLQMEEAWVWRNEARGWEVSERAYSEVDDGRCDRIWRRSSV